MKPTRYKFLDHGGVLAFAHRGGAREAPENTMKAFAYAVDLGYTYLETDAYATRDGVLVSFHDDKLDRVTDRKGKVEALSWNELREARIDGREPIPLLEDIFATWPQIRVNIDPKHDAAVAPLVALIKRLGIEDRICVGSFSGKRIRQFHDAFDGRLCTALGPASVLKLKGATLGLPLRDFREGCAQVSVRAPGMTLVDRAFVAAAERYNLQVHVWTIDDEAEMNRLLDMGVHGLMTDRPRVLKDVLVARGKWV
jgi:glycerophosphoryl diester phosphodiesterase